MAWLLAVLLLTAADEGAQRKLHKACLKGDDAACAELAQTAPPAMAMEALRVSCDRGSAEACLRLGEVEGDPRRAVEAWEAGCEAGGRHACELAAFRRLSGDLGEVAADEARVQLEQRCASSDADACTWLAAAHLGGWGGATDVRLARSFLEKACQTGAQDACRHREALSGAEVPARFSAAHGWLTLDGVGVLPLTAGRAPVGAFSGGRLRAFDAYLSKKRAGRMGAGTAVIDLPADVPMRTVRQVIATAVEATFSDVRLALHGAAPAVGHPLALAMADVPNRDEGTVEALEGLTVLLVTQGYQVAGAEPVVGAATLACGGPCQDGQWPLAELGSTLARVKAAHPAHTWATLLPETETSYGVFWNTLATMRQDPGSGRVLFPYPVLPYRVIADAAQKTSLGQYVDPLHVERVVATRQQELRYCWQKERGGAGDAVVRVVVAVDGAVSAARVVESSFGNPSLDACLEATFLRLDFTGVKGLPLDVEVPLAFYGP